MEEARRLRLKAHQDSFAFSDAAFPALGGGWGNGKTLAGCLYGVLRSEESPNNLGMIARKHFTDLRDSTLSDFLEWFGDRVRFNKADMTATFANGSKILFRHLQNAQLSNLNLGWFWIEQAEEIPESFFLQLQGRLRRKDVKRHQGAITFNMRGHNWVWRTWKQKQDEDGLPLAKPADYQLITAATDANKDNLPPVFLERLMRLPEPVRNRFVFGSWDEFEGRIWPQFQEHSHVIAPFTPPEGWEVFESADHGYNNPTAWLWWTVDYDGNLYVFDEHYQAGQTVAEHAKAIKAIRKRHGIEDRISYTAIDPSTRNREGITGLSVMAEYEDNGITTLTPANNDVLAGVNRVAEYLTVNPERIHPLTKKGGSPKLFVTRNCVHTIEEWQDYVWQVFNNRLEQDQPERPRKWKDHTCDCAKYGVLSRPDTPVLIHKPKPGSHEDIKQRYLEVVRAEQEEEMDEAA